MKRILGLVGAAAVLALMVTIAGAAQVTQVLEVGRAKYPAGVCTPDSSGGFILEGNSGSAPTCNDTTAAFYIGNLASSALGVVGGTNAYPLIRVSVAGVPTGVAVDTIRAFIDLAQNKNGPWSTAGASVPTGWDITMLQNAPTAASDTTGAGATKALYAAGSTALSPLSTVPVYSGCLNLTGVTIGSSVASPVGWKYARLRLTGDKTTGTISSLFGTKVWVSFPVNVADPSSAGEPQ